MYLLEAYVRGEWIVVGYAADLEHLALAFRFLRAPHCWRMGRRPRS